MKRFLIKSTQNVIRAVQNKSIFLESDREIYKRILEDYWSPIHRAKRFHLFNEPRAAIIHNTYMIDDKVDRVKPRLQFRDIKILVVGCGGGISTETLAELNFDVTGIDPNPEFMTTAKDHQKRNKLLRGKRLQYYQTTIEDFHKQNVGKFDAVLISEVLEYLDYGKKDQFLKDCAKCCKDEGNLFITTLNFTYSAFLWSIAFDTEPNFCAVPIRWTRGTRPERLKKMLKECGWNVASMKGIKFNFMDGKFELDSGLQRWYFVTARRNLCQPLLVNHESYSL